MAKKDKKAIVAITFSIVALAVAVAAGVCTYKLKTSFNDAEAFNAKVETGIDAYVKKQQAAQQGAQQAPAAQVDPVNVSYEGSPVKGEKDAPITIVEFSDYECPYCSRYVNSTYKQIVEKYVETGKVKYSFRNFPLGFHQNAKPAAAAALCARDQKGDDMYFQYHDLLFSDSKDLGEETLKKYAKELGLDEAEFATCLTDGKFDAQISKDMAEGQTYGVRGTPAFFINGRMLSGAQPFAAFESVIEAELNK